jgi:hypothetical protein
MKLNSAKLRSSAGEKSGKAGLRDGDRKQTQSRDEGQRTR